MKNALFKKLTPTSDRIDGIIGVSLSNLQSFDHNKISENLSEIKAAIYLCEEIGDKKRQATANMIAGITYYELGNFKEALSYHIKADQIWDNICNNNYDKQYELNNCIYMLKAIVNSNIEPERRAIIMKKCAKSKSRIIWLRSLLINLPYGLGIIIDNRIQDFVVYPQFH